MCKGLRVRMKGELGMEYWNSLHGEVEKIVGYRNKNPIWSFRSQHDTIVLVFSSEVEEIDGSEN